MTSFGHEKNGANANHDSGMEAQAANIPTEYPPLVTRDLTDEDIWDIEGRILINDGPHSEARLSRGDFRSLEPRWQVEQRLGAINDARENGTITSEVADALELDTLRKFREMMFNAKGRSLRIPLSVAHEIAERNGNAPINVSKPDSTPLRDYKFEA